MMRKYEMRLGLYGSFTDNAEKLQNESETFNSLNDNSETLRNEITN
jgi:hypothetical protein